MHGAVRVEILDTYERHSPCVQVGTGSFDLVQNLAAGAGGG